MTRVILRLTVLTAAAATAVGAALAADWPQWRGPDRTGVSSETGLLKSWPAGGPKLLWTATGCGAGYGSVAVADGKIFTTGYLGEEEHVVCLSADGGKVLWTAAIGAASAPRKKGEKRGGESIGYPGSRSTPTVDGGRVYAVSSLGDMVCCDTAGKKLWGKSFPKEFGGSSMSGWGFAESPLIDGDKVIVTPGGADAALVALDKKTGAVIWKAAIPGGRGAGYASAVVSEAGGVRQYVQVLDKKRGVVGVDAAGGKLLWSYNRICNGTANIPTPIIKGDHVLASTGYNDGGTALLKLSKSGDGFRAEEIWYKNNAELQNHHGGMVLIGDHVYLGHGHNNGFPTCVELLTGNIVWGKERGPGANSAALTAADGMLYFRYQDHTMALIEATPTGKRIAGTFKIPNGQRESWAHPVVSGGKLYLRNQDQLLCYDVKAQ
jgi:outer membrane protein assembly factor BamB